MSSVSTLPGDSRAGWQGQWGQWWSAAPSSALALVTWALLPKGGGPGPSPREAPLHLDVVPSSGGLTRSFDPHCSAPVRGMVNPAPHCLCSDRACGPLSTPCSHMTELVAAGPWRFSGSWVLVGFRTGLGSKPGFSRPSKLEDKEEGLWEALGPLPNLTRALPYLLWNRSHWCFWK